MVWEEASQVGQPVAEHFTDVDSCLFLWVIALHVDLLGLGWCAQVANSRRLIRNRRRRTSRATFSPFLVVGQPVAKLFPDEDSGLSLWVIALHVDSLGLGWCAQVASSRRLIRNRRRRASLTYECSDGELALQVVSSKLWALSGQLSHFHIVV